MAEKIEVSEKKVNHFVSMFLSFLILVFLIGLWYLTTLQKVFDSAGLTEDQITVMEVNALATRLKRRSRDQPTSPMTPMAKRTPERSRLFHSIQVRYPTPSSPNSISAGTTATSAAPNEMRNPATIAGAAPGRTTLNNLVNQDSCKMLAIWRYSFLSDFTPKAVLAMVGQIAAIKTTKTAVVCGSLTVYNNSGIQASGEMGFRI